MVQEHAFSFHKIQPQTVRAKGSKTEVTAKELPILKNIALVRLKIAPGCAREPHWHPNAGEMNYCVKGKALVTIFHPKNDHNTFTVEPGEVFYVPKGYLHHISNISNEEAELILAFSHQNPETIELSSSVNSMPAYVLGDTFGISAEIFDKIHEKKAVVFTNQQVNEKPNLPSIPSHFKLSIEKLNPQLVTSGGLARIANKHTLPILEDLALFSLRINGRGVREPHWHPNADELNFILTGRAKLIVLSPNGEIDTYEIGPGEGSFIPASYFHYIENIGDEELHMTVFFSNSTPNDLGISGALGAYSNELLSALFEVPIEHFKNLPKIQEDVMIVSGKK